MGTVPLTAGAPCHDRQGTHLLSEVVTALAPAEILEFRGEPGKQILNGSSWS